jgi:Galactose oxidase, central domain
VFIAGGTDHTGTTLTSTVIYDPVSGASPGPDLLTPRERHTATLLPDGRVLIAGGRQPNATPPPPYIVLPSAEIYDPALNTITAVGSAMGDARFAHSDVLLDDGRTLVAGGSNDPNNPTATSLASADFFSFSSGAFAALPAAPMGALLQARREFSMTKLTDSWVLAVGGIDSSGNRLLSSELFEPGPGLDLFATGVSMTNARSGHTATRLQDGRVLVTGGTGASGAAINSAELYNGPF